MKVRSCLESGRSPGGRRFVCPRCKAVVLVPAGVEGRPWCRRCERAMITADSGEVRAEPEGQL